MLNDLLDWVSKGADPFNGINKVPFLGISADEINALFEYKADPFITDDISNAVNVMTQHYGQFLHSNCYRGIYKDCYHKLMKRIKTGETVFQRNNNRITSVSTDFNEAKVHASNDDGIQVGGILTIQCQKKIFHYDEFLFYTAIAHKILGKMSYSQKEMVNGIQYQEREWLIPANSTWKLIDNKQLLFNVNYT